MNNELATITLNYVAHGVITFDHLSYSLYKAQRLERILERHHVRYIEVFDISGVLGIRLTQKDLTHFMLIKTKIQNDIDNEVVDFSDFVRSITGIESFNKIFGEREE